MGVSDDERREIAAKLREQAGYDNTSIGMWWHRLQVTVLDEASFLRPDTVFDALADLIDRPTCENEATAGGFGCSCCGDTYPVDERFMFCPTCGAEVIR